IAWCNDCGGSSPRGMHLSSTAPTRCARSWDQIGKATSGFIAVVRRGTVGSERFEHSLFEDLHLLLSVLESGLTILEQLGASFVSCERIGERQLATLHGRDDGFQLGERGLEGLGRRSGFFWHGGRELGGQAPRL